MALLSSVKQLIQAAPLAAHRGKVFDPAYEFEVWSILGYHPKAHQHEMAASRKRFRCDVVHRRGGKSVQKVLKLITRAYWCPMPHGRYAYLGPTYSQTEDIIWGYVQAIHEQIPGSVLLTSKLAIIIPTATGGKSRIRLYGVDSPKQRLRGAYLDGCVIDEFQDCPEHVWQEQVRPMLSDDNRRAVDMWGHPNQWCDFVGTPKGRNQLYRFHHRAMRWQQGMPVILRDDEGVERPVISHDWGGVLEPVTKTQMIKADELALIRIDIGAAKYAQEYLCSFDAAIEGAIYGQELAEIAKLNQIMQVPINPNVPINTCFDLGWDDMTAVWFFQQIGTNIYFVDYLELRHASLSTVARKLGEKGYLYGYHLFPHDVEVTDGLSREDGKSRRAILQELGIRVTVVKKHTMWDGIAAVRAMLPRCYFDADRCQEGLDRLALYHRRKDPQTGMFSEEPEHDENSHGADAIRMCGMGRKKVWQDTVRATTGQF